jgi:hypothetical protein
MQDLTPMPAEHRRLTFGLMLSLAAHAMLLSLAFGGQGLGLAGFGLRLPDQRTEVPDMHIVLLPTPVPAAEPLLSKDVEQADDAKLTMMTAVYVAPPAKLPAAESAPQASPEQVPKNKMVATSPVLAAISRLPAERPIEKAASPPKPKENLIAMAKSDKPTWAVPPAPGLPAPATAVATPPLLDAADPKPDEHSQAEQLEAARQETAKQAATQQEAAKAAAAKAEAVRRETERNELAKQAAARLEAVRQAAARAQAERQEIAEQAAIQQEAARQDAARAAAAKIETARIEAERHELAKQTAAKQAATQQEAARQEAARAETARVESERQEASRQADAKQAAVRQAVIQIEVARLAALQAEAEKRQEKLRAIGRQINEEAARRDAAKRQLPTVSSARRGRLFGRSDPNAALVLYAQTWSQKIELNMTFDMVREAAKQPHTDPMVTVAVRSDGSVESVTFVVSSGVPAIDEAIRRIVQSQANYQAFPPALTKDFDVIEIRRTWHFDMAIRLY